jgi:kynurenine formamidase
VRTVDLSHSIRPGMEVHPGLPSPRVTPVLSREASRGRYGEGTEFFIGSLEVVGNAGTYMDSPFHRLPGGADMAGLPLERLVELEAVVVRVPESVERRVGVEHLPPGVSLAGRAVLFHTGWDRRWGTVSYFAGGHPFLTEPLARRLADEEPAVVGTDACNVDDTRDVLRPAHTHLLGAGIPIVENLRGLEALPALGARFYAAPVGVEGMASFPVRAFARIADGRA